MTVKTRSITTTAHYIEVDGIGYPTTFEAAEYIDARVDMEGRHNAEGTLVTIVYAARDECSDNPRDHFDPCGTMVRVRDGYNGIDIDVPDSDIAAALEVAQDLIDYFKRAETEIFYVVKCGCAWSGHALDEVETGECAYPYEALIVGGEDSTFPDGSTLGKEFGAGGDHDLDLEGVAAMFMKWKRDHWSDAYDLTRAYVGETRPDITGFMRWDISGYSQSDWAEGYIYTTRDDLGDPIAALKAEVREYDAWAKGDVYVIAKETYRLLPDGEVEHIDYECVGGYYGDDETARLIQTGDVF
jgi:hypothetical protein